MRTHSPPRCANSKPHGGADNQDVVLDRAGGEEQDLRTLQVMVSNEGVVDEEHLSQRRRVEAETGKRRGNEVRVGLDCEASPQFWAEDVVPHVVLVVEATEQAVVDGVFLEPGRGTPCPNKRLDHDHGMMRPECTKDEDVLRWNCANTKEIFMTYECGDPLDEEANPLLVVIVLEVDNVLELNLRMPRIISNCTTELANAKRST